MANWETGQVILGGHRRVSKASHKESENVVHNPRIIGCEVWCEALVAFDVPANDLTRRASISRRGRRLPPMLRVDRDGDRLRLLNRLLFRAQLLQHHLGGTPGGATSAQKLADFGEALQHGFPLRGIC